MELAKFSFKGLKISDNDTILIETHCRDSQSSSAVRDILSQFIAKNNIKNVDIVERFFYVYDAVDHRFNITLLSANSLDMAFETTVLESK